MIDKLTFKPVIEISSDYYVVLKYSPTVRFMVKNQNGITLIYQSFDHVFNRYRVIYQRLD